jgi:hypothetical protein
MADGCASLRLTVGAVAVFLLSAVPVAGIAEREYQVELLSFTERVDLLVHHCPFLLFVLGLHSQRYSCTLYNS